MRTPCLVTLTAGGLALVAGPGVATVFSVLASIASLLLTSDNARSVGELLCG
jgi:hypothetical protein